MWYKGLVSELVRYLMLYRWITGISGFMIWSTISEEIKIWINLFRSFCKYILSVNISLQVPITHWKIHLLSACPGVKPGQSTSERAPSANCLLRNYLKTTRHGAHGKYVSLFFLWANAPDLHGTFRFHINKWQPFPRTFSKLYDWHNDAIKIVYFPARKRVHTSCIHCGYFNISPRSRACWP